MTLGTNSPSGASYQQADERTRPPNVSQLNSFALPKNFWQYDIADWARMSRLCQKLLTDYTMVFSTWRQWLKRLAQAVRGKPRQARRHRLLLEKLEDRVTPSDAGVAWPTYIRLPLGPDFQPLVGPLKFKGAFTPAGIQLAYG